MPFLRAGFNAHNRRTGIRAWVRPIGGGRFAPAELLQFLPSGEYAWLGARFLAWGETCAFGTVNQIDLPAKWQHGLPQSRLPCS